MTLMTSGAPRTHASSRQLVLARHGVDVLLDVGANAGQYATDLLAAGFPGRVVSVEPLAEPYALLAEASAREPRWTAVRSAVAAATGTLSMHVTTDTRCSSVLAPAAITALPGGSPVAVAEVSASTLDDLCGTHVDAAERLAVKLDCQGYEREILLGGAATLLQSRVLEVEMALVATYEGAPLLAELLPELTGAGFSVVSIEPGHRDRTTGQVYDVDVLLERPV